MSSCLQRHWQENTHSTSFLPRLTLEQRAHSWRRATRADKKKKMLKNMMQASLTYWVAPRVCVCVYVCVCVCTLLFVWQKNPPDCNCSVFSPGHTLAEQWHLLCGCRKIFTFFFFFLPATVEYCLREGVHMKPQSDFDQIRMSSTLHFIIQAPPSLRSNARSLET